MNTIIPEVEMQRLIDGGLTASERKALTKLADQQPSSWRMIALAFVEEQVLRQQFGSLSTTSQAPVLPSASGRENSSWISIALSVALALVLGLFIGTQFVHRGSIANRTESHQPGLAALEVVVEELPVVLEEDDEPLPKAYGGARNSLGNEESAEREPTVDASMSAKLSMVLRRLKAVEEEVELLKKYVH